MNKHNIELAIELAFCSAWVIFFYVVSYVLIGGAK